MTVKQFLRKHKIRMARMRVDANPYRDPDDTWNDTASHWKCQFRRPGFQPGRDIPGTALSVYFSQGSAITEPPTASEVMDCLASEAHGVDESGGSFEAWADNYGYDTDSRRAFRTFRMCSRQAARLREFLGAAAYQELLYGVDGL